MEVTELKAAIEAIVFIAEEPVTLSKLREIFPEESADKIQTAVAELQAEFNRQRPGVEIREIAGGYRMTTRPEHHESIRAYLKTRPSAKLSLPALETLAVIAYRQPITLAEILAVRGIKSTSALRTLMEKKFVTPCGRKKVAGRPILYCTTREFLVHFGLKDLGDLPTLKEFEELIGMELTGRNMPEGEPATLPVEPDATPGIPEVLPQDAQAATSEIVATPDETIATVEEPAPPMGDSDPSVEISTADEVLPADSTIAGDRATE